MYNPFSLEGKTILITGASSGIGRTTAVECSRLGANVILTARNRDRLNETLSMLEGVNHMMIECNLSDGDDMNHLVTDMPLIDGVVLCAGKGLTMPALFSTRDKFDDVFNVNFFAPVELTRLLVKKKKFNKLGASIVTISSIGGPEVISIGNGIYGASKSALSTMMRFFALEFASKKIRVNSICPGMVETPLIHQDNLTQEQLNENASMYPLQCLGKPEDIAYAAAYLLSDASAWVTGTNMIIDGGITLKQ